MRLQAGAISGLLTAILLSLYGTANAQDEVLEPLSVTAPAPTPPFDADILERIRRAIAEGTSGTENVNEER